MSSLNLSKSSLIFIFYVFISPIFNNYSFISLSLSFNCCFYMFFTSSNPFSYSDNFYSKSFFIVVILLLLVISNIYCSSLKLVSFKFEMTFSFFKICAYNLFNSTSIHFTLLLSSTINLCLDSISFS